MESTRKQGTQGNGDLELRRLATGDVGDGRFGTTWIRAARRLQVPTMAWCCCTENKTELRGTGGREPRGKREGEGKGAGQRGSGDERRGARGLAWVAEGVGRRSSGWVDRWIGE